MPSFGGYALNHYPINALLVPFMKPYVNVT